MESDCVCVTSELKFKLSTVSTNTRQQLLTPLLYCFYNDGMIKFNSLFSNSQLQMFDFNYFTTIDACEQLLPAW